MASQNNRLRKPILIHQRRSTPATARILNERRTFAAVSESREKAPSHKKVSEWSVSVPNGPLMCVAARTKSEARGTVKRMLGWDRLPPGTTAERVLFEAAA